MKIEHKVINVNKKNEMERIRISIDSSNSYNFIYILYFFDSVYFIVLLIYTFVKLEFAISFIPPGVILSIMTFLVYKYSRKFCDTFIEGDYLILKQNSKTEKIHLSNIKSINYHSFFKNIPGEDTIVVDFFNESIFGKKIYISPTNLDRKNKYKFNQNILTFLVNQVDSLKEKNNKC